MRLGPSPHRDIIEICQPHPAPLATSGQGDTRRYDGVRLSVNAKVSGMIGASPPPPAPSPGAPKKRPGRRLAIIVSIVAVFLVGALVAGAVAVINKITHPDGPGDPGDEIAQPHRVAVPAQRPAPGEPAWTAPDHRWRALSNSWSADKNSSLFSFKAGQRALVSDGKRAIELRDVRLERTAPAVITAFDGATGKRSWQTKLPWAQGAGPVIGDGLVIVPTGPEVVDGPVTYVALDTATGKQRWRVRAGSLSVSLGSHGRPQPGGALLNGVFYYGDGKSVIGVDARTGAKRYAFTAKKYTVENSPITAGGQILLPVSPAGSSDSYKLLRLPANLRGSTSYPLAPGGLSTPRLAVNGDVLISWNDGYLVTTNLRTGKRLARIPLGVFKAYGGVAGRTLLISEEQSSGFRVIGYDLLTGRKRWSVNPFPDDGVSVGGADVADGTMFMARDRLAILAPDTGKTVFTRDVPDSYNGGVAVPAGGHVVFSFDQGVAGYR